MPKSLGHLGAHVEAVEEGSVSVGRATGTGQENPVTILDHAIVALCVGRHHRTARVVVAILGIDLEHELGLGATSKIDSPRAACTRGPFGLGQERHRPLTASKIGIAEGCAKNFRARPGEGSFEPHQLVPLWSGLPRIATVERFHVDDSMLLAVQPTEVATTRLHPADRHGLPQRHVGECGYHVPLGVPDLDIHGKGAIGD